VDFSLDSTKNEANPSDFYAAPLLQLTRLSVLVCDFHPARFRHATVFILISPTPTRASFAFSRVDHDFRGTSQRLVYHGCFGQPESNGAAGR
jgi:hypothetical protein